MSSILKRSRKNIGSAVKLNQDVDSKSKDTDEEKNKKKKKAIIILLLFIVLCSLLGFVTMSNYDVRKAIIDILNIDTPSAPKIQVVPTTWSKSATVSIKEDAISNSGISYYKYCISETKGSDSCDWVRAADKSVVISTSEIYYVYFRGVSNNGNEGAISNSVIAKVDNINPVIESYSFSNVTSTSVDINLDANDSLSGIDHIVYSIEGREDVTSSDLNYTLSDLTPDTTYNLVITVYDVVGNSINVLIPFTTLKETPAITDETCTTGNIITPVVTISPDNEKWSTYKDVTIDFGNNSCDKEISYDLGQTWEPYTGTIRFTKAGYITAREVNGKDIKQSIDYRVKYIDTVVPHITLSDVPSSFPYGSKYDIPSGYQFGEAGGEYACYDESGNKLGATTLMKVGNHTITCTAKGYNGLSTTVSKDITVEYRKDSTVSWDGWITLDLAYPAESINRKWKLFDSNVTVSTSSPYYQWMDYTGPITVKISDLEKIRMEYDINGKTVIANYSSTDMIVDITPGEDKYSIYSGETVPIHIKYNPGSAEYTKDNSSVKIENLYRINGGDWQVYNGPFNVGPNTLIEAKVVRTTSITDNNGNVTSVVDTESAMAAISKKSRYGGDDVVPDETNASNKGNLIITADENPIDDGSTTGVSINSTGGIEYIKYSLNGAGDIAYTDPFKVKSSTFIKAQGYIYTEGKLKTFTKTLYVASKSGTPPTDEAGKDYAPVNLKINVKDNPVAIGSTTTVSITTSVKTTIMYSIDGGEYREYSGEFSVEPNTMIEAYAINPSSSYYTEYDFVNVTGYTKTVTNPYNITFKNEYNDKTRMYTVTFMPNSGSRKICYQLDLGPADHESCKLQYTTPITVPMGQYIVAWYYDEATGIRSNDSFDYTGLVWDPTTYGPGEVYSPIVRIVPSTHDITNSVTIKLDAAYYSTLKYSLDGIIYQNYTGPFVVSENTKVYAMAESSVGRAYDTYNITNIGTTSGSTKNNGTGGADNGGGSSGTYTPSSNRPNAASSLTIQTNPSDPANVANLKAVQVDVIYSDDAVTKYYRIGSTGTWQTYTGSFYVDYNTTIYAYEKGPNGYATKELLVNYFASGLADPVITSSPDNSVASTIDTISIEFDSNAISKTYSINNGAAIEYTEPFDVKENCTIEAISTNNAGQLTYSTYYVTNIAPESKTVTDYEDYKIIHLYYPTNALKGSEQYKEDSDNDWKTYNDHGIMIITNDKYSDYVDKDGHVIVNGIDYTDDCYVTDMDITEYKNTFHMKYDTVKSNPPTIVPVTTAVVTKVGINIIYDDNLLTKEYRLVYEDGTDTGWLNYTDTIYIDKNNTKVYARGKDSTSTYTTEAKPYLVTNVGIKGAIAVIRDYETLTATISNLNQAFAIDHYLFSIDGINYTSSDSATYKFSGLSINTNYNIYVKVVDVKGNITGPYIGSGTTLNFASPVITVDPSNTTWKTSKSVSINYHDEYYEGEVTYKKYYKLVQNKSLCINTDGLTRSEINSQISDTVNATANDVDLNNVSYYLLSTDGTTYEKDSPSNYINNLSEIPDNLYVKYGQIDYDTTDSYLIKGSNEQEIISKVNNLVTSLKISNVAYYEWSIDDVNFNKIDSSTFDYKGNDKEIYVKITEKNTKESEAFNIYTGKYTKSTCSDDQTYPIDSGWILYTGPFTIDKNYSIYAKTESDTSSIISQPYNETTVDTTGPVVDLITSETHTDKFSVYVSAHDTESTVTDYYYSLDNINWTDLHTKENTFSGLKENNNYTVYVKVKNSSGIMSDVYSLTVKTVELTVPTVVKTIKVNDLDKPNLDESGNIKKWGYGERVFINFPNYDGDVNYEYSLDDGNTWETYTADGAVIRKENGTLIAREVSGDNVISSTTYTASYIDRYEPSIDFDGIPKVIQIGDSYDIPSNYDVDNTKSGGSYVCTVNNDPAPNNTSLLRTGYQNLSCTVTTGAGHSYTATRKLPVYASLTYNVDSILQGVQDLTLDDGDYRFVVTNGNDEETYNIELWNYDSEDITKDTTKCDNVSDYKICVLKYSGDLTIESGASITPYVRKDGFLVYVGGTLTNKGTISANGKGGSDESGNVYLWKNEESKYEYVPGTSAVGGVAVLKNSNGALAGVAGTSGYFRGTGAGGSGAAYSTANGYIKAGNGASGSGYSGGAGGGAVVTSNNYSGSSILTGNNASSGFGAQGKLATTNTSLIAGGGAGADSGESIIYKNVSNVYKNSTYSDNDSKAGGLLILYSDTYNNEGTVSADGLPADNVTAGGGSAGGGSINIFYKNLIKKGTTTETGGAASGVNAKGGAGGNGTATYNKLEDAGMLGTSTNPFKIYTVQDLMNVTEENRDYREGYYELMNDIDLSSTTFTSLSTTEIPFSGDFDGNGYTISGLKSTGGLFTSLYTANIHDLKLSNVNITSTIAVGAIANTVTSDNTITNVNVTGSITSSTGSVGGVIGSITPSDNNTIDIDSVTFNGTVSASSNVGGLVGYINSTNHSVVNITNSSSTGLVNGSSSNTGGLIGYGATSTFGKLNITSDYSNSNVTSINSTSNNIGGLVGYLFNNDKDAYIKVDSSYATGKVVAVSNSTGGLIGSALSSYAAKTIEITKSYATGAVENNAVSNNSNYSYGNYVGGLIGGATNVNINNSYETGSIKGPNFIGGLVGNAENSEITNTYTIGAINHTSTITSDTCNGSLNGLCYGGFAGRSVNSTATNSYYSVETGGVQRSALGINYRIQQLLKKNDNAYTNWDFDSIWDIEEGSSTAYLRNVFKPTSVDETNIVHTVLDGDGTVSDPYLIHNATEFNEIYKELNANYKQVNDIDANNTAMSVKAEVQALFSGTYDGDNYKISNINNNANSNNYGMFTFVNGGTIKNVNVTSSTTTGGTSAGILIGYAKNIVNLDNISLTGKLSGASNLGGIIGYAEGGLDTININNVNVDATINGTSNLGGAIGYIYNVSSGTIQFNNVITTGSVTGTSTSVGGLVGYSQNVSTGNIYIDNSGSSATVSGSDNVGGLVGYLYNQYTGIDRVYRSYFTGNVNAKGTSIGGIVGYQRGIYGNTAKTLVRECYSTGKIVSTSSYVGGITGNMLYSEIYDSYTTGAVSGADYVGSLIGYMNYSKATNAYSMGKLTYTGGNVSASVGKIDNMSNAGTNILYSSQTIGVVKTAFDSSSKPFSTNKKVWKLLKQETYTGYDFDSIWSIDENSSTAYLKNVVKPKDVEESSYTYNKMDGTGTVDDPYQIVDMEDFDDIRNEVQGNYKFVADVDGGNNSFSPLAESTVVFTGSIDGNGHTLSNVSVSGSQTNYGLITYCSNFVAKNLTLNNITVNGVANVGLLCGYNVGGLNIDNVDIKSSTLKATSTSVGGLIGYNYNTTTNLINVKNSDITSSTITGGSYVGGLVGNINNTTSANNTLESNTAVDTTVNSGTFAGLLFGKLYNGGVTTISIKDSSTSGTLNSTGEYVGGTIGSIAIVDSSSSITLDNLSNSANITGNRVGGILGQIDSSGTAHVVISNLTNEGTISKYNNNSYYGGVIGVLNNTGIGVMEMSDSHSTGKVIGYNQTGGLIGLVQNINQGTTKITNCYATGDVSGNDYVGGLIGYNYNSVTNGTATTDSVYATGNVSATGSFIGGLIGRYYGANQNVAQKLTNAYATGSATGVSYVGGLVGQINYMNNYDATYSTGTVTGSGSYVGGLIGQGLYIKSITNSYSHSNVTGGGYVGGLIGQSESNSISITYSDGDVTGTSNTGGFIGHGNYNTITNVYSLGKVTGGSGFMGTAVNSTITNAYAYKTMENGNASFVGTATNTTQSCSYFVSEISHIIRGSIGNNLKKWEALIQSYYVGWDFDSIWGMDENEFPHLLALPNSEKDKASLYNTHLLDGDGSKDNPYLIYNVEDLYNTRYDLDAYYKVMADIDFSTDTYAFSPIGEDGTPFAGTFDGNSHTISNYVGSGIFASTNNAVIKNWTLSNFTNENVSSTTGSLITHATGALDIENIHATGTLKSTYSTDEETKAIKSYGVDYIGGIIGKGECSNVTINDVSYDGDIIGHNYIGGLFGYLSSNTAVIKGVSAKSNILATGYYGGIAGYLGGDITGDTITSTGSIIGKGYYNDSTNKYVEGNYAGGIVGYLNGSYTGNTITSTGSVEILGGYAGGIAGMTTGSIFASDSINHTGDITASQSYVGSLVGNATNSDVSSPKTAFTGTLSGVDYVGGMAGNITGNLSLGTSTIDVTVNGKGNYVGGIAGKYVRSIDTPSVFSGIPYKAIVTGVDYVGSMFGYLGNTTTGAIQIDNTILNGSTSGDDHVGGIAGYVGNTSSGSVNFDKVTINSPITSTGSYLGGITGEINNSSTGSITVTNDNISTGNLSTTKDYVGGIAGYVGFTGAGTININNTPINLNVTGANYVGGLIGYNYDTLGNKEDINNIYVVGNVTGSGSYVGGLIGKSENSSMGSVTLDTVYYKGDVSGISNVAGFIGQAIQSSKGTTSINLAYATGNVTGSDPKNAGANDYVGGAVGQLNAISGSYSAITQTYTDMNVKGDNYVAGFVGASTYGILKDDYSLSIQTGSDYVGGFIGTANYTSITDCYSIGAVHSTGRNVGGFVGTSTTSTATNSYFSADINLINRTALGINISYPKMLTIDPCYKNWNFTDVWGIDYESTTAYLKALPIPDKVKKSNQTYSDITGSGTVSDPYVIRNYLDLTNIVLEPTGYYILANDISVPDGYEYYPQGDIINPFTGTLDGKNYTISGINTVTGLNQLGLFGATDGATIKDLKLSNIDITNSLTDSSDIGLLVGNAKNTTINNVNVQGVISTRATNVGGLVGSASGNTSITNTTVNATVEGTTNVSLLAGYINNSEGTFTINTTNVSGSVTGTTNVGAYAGNVTNSGVVNISGLNVDNKVSVEGTTNVGGFIGYTNDNNGTTNITDVTVTDTSIIGTTNVGGLIGSVNSTNASTTDIENITIKDEVSGSTAVGIMTGYVGNLGTSSMVFNNVKTSGKATNKGAYTGGIIGELYNSSSGNVTLINSNTSGVVSGNTYSGGIIGYVNNVGLGSTNLTKLYSNGDVNGTGDYTAGVIAVSNNTAKGKVNIDQVYTTSKVEGLTNVGGFIGTGTYNTITNTYTYGSVAGTTNVGGYASSLTNCNVSTSYTFDYLESSYPTNISSSVVTSTNSTYTNFYYDSDRFIHNSSNVGEYLTSSEFLTKSSFENYNFDSIWSMDGEIPYLTNLVKPEFKLLNINNVFGYTVVDLNEFFKKNLNVSGLYKVIVDSNGESIMHYIHVYTYDGDTEFSENKSFGLIGDVASANTYAYNMVGVKVKGNLTIDSGVTASVYYSSTYGGPKGFTMAVSDTLTNNGTIDNSHGAKALGENVYLLRDPNYVYEYVPSTGADGISAMTRQNVTGVGTTGTAGTGRQTGAGGRGGYQLGNGFIANFAKTGSGSSYYGGAGTGGLAYTGGGGGTDNQPTLINDYTGGTGSNNDYAYVASSLSGGGAGVIAGTTAWLRTSGQTLVESGTGAGGLLTIYTNSIGGAGSITAEGHTAPVYSGQISNNYTYGAVGGSSGGGSINVFYNTNNYTGTTSAAGGISTTMPNLVTNGNSRLVPGGIGGNGTVTFFKYGTYTDVKAPVITIDKPYMSQDKTVTITSTETNYKLQYSIDMGKTWTDYTKTFSLITDTVVIARVAFGNTTLAASSYNVTNFDTEYVLMGTIYDANGNPVKKANLVTFNDKAISDTSDANGNISLSGITGVTEDDSTIYLVNNLVNVDTSGKDKFEQDHIATATFNINDANTGNTVTLKFTNGYTAVVTLLDIKTYAATNNITYGYTGNYQTYAVPLTALYKIEVWGAKGGNDGYVGGNGGYSVGTFKLEKGTNLYIYVGGIGANGACGTGGGYNGGGNAGNSCSSGGGGGATDVRTIKDDLYSRFIVAGGGGGGGLNSAGGAGGGTTGVQASGRGSAGSQNSGYSFGYGQSYGGGDGGGGGAGWYGGYAANGDVGGAGGSGFVLSASSVQYLPTGYKVDSSLYAQSSNMIVGNASMPTFDGTSTMVGNSGNGHVRITLAN